jgi:DNA-binding response OmpR family regulator
MARILILREEPAWGAALSRCLEPNHELIITDRISKAVEALHNESFDLVITHVHLKNQDVFQFLREIKSDPILASTRVLCFCARRSRYANIANAALDKVSRAMGADCYLSVDRFCTGDNCDFAAMKRAIESVIK